MSTKDLQLYHDTLLRLSHRILHHVDFPPELANFPNFQAPCAASFAAPPAAFASPPMALIINFEALLSSKVSLTASLFCWVNTLSAPLFTLSPALMAVADTEFGT